MHLRRGLTIAASIFPTLMPSAWKLAPPPPPPAYPLAALNRIRSASNFSGGVLPSSTATGMQPCRSH